MSRKWIWSAVLIGGQCAALAGCTQHRPWEGLKNPFAKTETSTATLASSTDNPSKEEGKLAMARLCERRGELQQAETLYRELLKENPDQQRLHHRLGVIAAQQGKYAQADEHFQRAMASGSPDVELLCDAGYSLYLQHRLSDAEVVLRQALERQPQNARVCNNLGLVLGEQGRLDESLTMFKRAGQEADAYTNLGYVLAQIGDLEGAQRMYSHALTLDNSIRPAAEAMLQLAHRQKQLDEMMLAHKSRTEPAGTAATTESLVAEVRDVERRDLSHNKASAEGAERATPGLAMLPTIKGVVPAAAAQQNLPNDSGSAMTHAATREPVTAQGKSVSPQPWQPPQVGRAVADAGKTPDYMPTPWGTPSPATNQRASSGQSAAPEVVSTALEVPTQREPWPAANSRAAMQVEVSDHQATPQPALQTVPASYEQSPFSWRNILRR